jgi:hypothetical protein
MPQPAQDMAQGLEGRIRFARSETELDQAVEEIQAGFEAAHLAQVGGLAHLAMNTARQMAGGWCNMPVREL